MAVINNTCTEIGDVLNIFSQGAISSDTLALTGFTDSISGETGTRFFNKLFRYSLDGITYSDWIELTDLNIAAISGNNVVGLVYFEFKYIRAGTDTTGVLQFDFITIEGNITIHVCNNTSTINTIFEQLTCDNVLTAEVCKNLLQKIYYSGIIPEYVERNNSENDEDYISYWNSVCFYLSMFIVFCEQFEKIFYEKDFLRKYLEESDIKLQENITFADLQYISENFYEEINKRGTILTWYKKGKILKDSSINPIDGELYRLLCPNDWDEYLIELIERKHAGLNIGNNWLTYNGTCYSNQLNKTKENSDEFISLSNYELLGSSFCSIENDPQIDKDVFKITSDSSVKVGIGYDLSSPPPAIDISKLITVDDEVDYEITFNFKRLSGSGNFKFGVISFNKEGVLLSDGTKRISDSLITNLFLAQNSSNVFKIIDQYYFVRCIIHAKNSINSMNTIFNQLNLGYGNNLKFNESLNVCKIYPCIYSETTVTPQELLIYDFKIRPLIRGKNILPLNEIDPDTMTNVQPYIKNPHFIQNVQFVYAYVKNNNGKIPDNKFISIVEKDLIPYQNKFEIISLNNTR